jgi:serralysin
MASVANVSLTGNAYVDGLLVGVKWASGSLTYSFPTSASLYGSYPSNEPNSGFLAFSAAQQAAIAKILNNYSAVANLQFSKVTESSSTSGIIRYAETNAISTGMTYYPSTMDRGGDAWFNQSNHYYDNPVMGNYAYELMIHETGHALGLKHPQDVFGSFGLLPSAHDALPYTVMSYRSYVGGPMNYTAAATSYPQTLMMDDIRALQTLYGANYTTNSGNTVYSWSPTTGAECINGVAQTTPAGNKIFMTVWDGGGTDTYDFSNYTTGVNVDLNPGGWTKTSSTQLACLASGHNAPGNIANAYLFQNNAASLIENATGGSGADVINGNQANNSLKGGPGNDILNGCAGTDTAVYSGLSTDYKWTQNSDATWTVTDLRAGSPDGTDRLANIDKLQFTNATITLNATIVSTDTYPVMTSTPAAASLTEWGDGSTNEKNNVAHTAKGTLTYWDPDLADTHVASFVTQASGYVGTFKLGTVDETGDCVSWSYSVADSAIDFLGAGATLIQKYDVKINDLHGGIAVQTVCITLIGKSDAVTTTTTSPAGGGIAPENSTDWPDIDTAPTPARDAWHTDHLMSDHPVPVHSLEHAETSDWLLL